MVRRTKILACSGALVLSAGGLGACGSRQIALSHSDPNFRGAQIFSEQCSGCHTLDTVGAIGSATKVRDRERVDGPNFNVRKETADQVLYAIRNGGFSGAIMPENLVTGADAQKVARFLAKYSGLEARKPVGPATPPPAGAGGGGGSSAGGSGGSSSGGSGGSSSGGASSGTGSG